MSIMNGGTSMRLEFIVTKVLCKLTFESPVGEKLLGLTHFQHQDCVCWDPYCHITAAELFQYLIMKIMNGGSSMRLEFIVTKGLHKLTFESRVGEKLAWSYPLSAPRLWGKNCGLVLPTFSTKIVCVGILTAISQQLNCSNVSLGHQDVCWDPCCHITAAELFQCLITGVTTVVEKLAWSYPLSTP
eukprot:scaffold125837_cov59-Cyclotella_meneghiniana.AAC.1